MGRQGHITRRVSPRKIWRHLDGSVGYLRTVAAEVDASIPTEGRVEKGAGRGELSHVPPPPALPLSGTEVSIMQANGS